MMSDRGRGQSGASFPEHARFAFHDLADGVHVCSGEGLRQFLNQGVDFFGRAGGRNFDRRGLHASPAFEILQ